MNAANFHLNVTEINLVHHDVLWNNDDLDEIIATVNPDELQMQVTELYENIPNIHDNSQNEADQPKRVNENSENDSLPRKKLKQTEDDLRSYVQGNRNKNTKEKTSRESQRFKDYVLLEGELREIHTIPPKQLDVYIGSFLKDLKTKNGKEYEPDSISSFFRYF